MEALKALSSVKGQQGLSPSSMTELFPRSPPEIYPSSQREGSAGQVLGSGRR